MRLRAWRCILGEGMYIRHQEGDGDTPPWMASRRNAWKWYGGVQGLANSAMAADDWVAYRGGTAEQRARVRTMMEHVGTEPYELGAAEDANLVSASAVDGDGEPGEGVDEVLLPKQEKFLAGVANGLTPPEAAKAAGYRYPTQHAVDAAIVPSIRRRFRRILHNRVRLTKLADRLAEGLDSEDVRFFAHQGVVTDEKSVPDMRERRLYAETIAKLIGVEPEKKAAAPAQQTTVVIAPWMRNK